jgi:hypothetical protein
VGLHLPALQSKVTSTASKSCRGRMRFSMSVNIDIHVKAHKMPYSVVVATLLGLVGCAANAQGACDALAEGAADYDRARKVVVALPEVNAWAQSHSFPIAFMPVVDKQQRIAQRCFWSVTVYASRPERTELWRSFFVQVGGNMVMVRNLEGEPISLAKWRKAQSRGAPS